MELKVSSLAERPDKHGQVVGMTSSWPEFVTQDLVGDSHYGRIATELPQYVLFAEDERGEVVAHAYSVPFALAAEGRGQLPARGWDAVLLWAFADLRRGVRPDTVSAIAITVAPHVQGRGLSTRMLSAMRDSARAQGFSEVVAPVRPSAKHLEPRTPMAEYAHRTRPDGLPQDPWLRVHARAGATVDSVAPASMTVSGSLDQWRRWTELPFDTEGDVEVPGALVPVHCEPDRGYAVYVEPNVWMRHPL
ncbi:GNAT family N-acetyltransferase [Streptomyces resistomycificus]|uniref:Acetyltransferase-like protein n=1 Tax=Streptomyces resistomycificus TaxID=67356 RepID=A0A0L8KSG1_9ACTN|nr:GNAT family N-acetyltransferase [Streptomyces resistomycificus]KOG28654.1 acetyltransferase-like protein [Streptomyces resistomycificus]KUN95969.1 acetyltransferase-like protein [Streptomyces resistomycificus]